MDMFLIGEIEAMAMRENHLVANSQRFFSQGPTGNRASIRPPQNVYPFDLYTTSWGQGSHPSDRDR